MSDVKRTEIAEYGEFGLIHHLTKNNENKNATTVLGIGDDAAVIDPMGKHIVVSTDMLVEGIHFDLGYMPLKHLGYKSVMVNLSDIYAMMATPTQITVSLAISNRFSVEALEELYEGIYLACKKHNVDVVGGDTTSSPKGLVMSITAIGEVAENKHITRSGAKENDLICVSGSLGGAYLGLLLLEREKKIHLEHPTLQPDISEYNFIVERLLKPEARKDIVEFLQEQNIVPTSMIDISDGLSSELLHICNNSKVGCMIYESKIPINENTTTAAKMFNMVDTTCALNGGEDYELLFTVPQQYYEQINNHDDLHVIGYVTPELEGPKITTNGNNVHKLTAQGWNHMV
jgi:thiamine-monophosphate kinase